MTAAARRWSCAILFAALTPACASSQDASASASHVLAQWQLEKMLVTPQCLEGYRSNQTGPLSRIDAKPGERDTATFTVDTLTIPSDGVRIRGWLYLPKRAGKVPLIVLTNGGGDGSRQIKSLSDWIAPILAHCGIAALVHDKRGTGESTGNFAETTYDDYVTDAGNSAVFLSTHKRINARQIGVMGGSEGGRIAVLAASRYPVVGFAISFAGTVVSMEDDRLYAQMGGFKANGVSDSVIALIAPLWQESFAAWASNDPADHQKVNEKIVAARTRFGRSLVPATREEMESIPDFRAVLPTWRSLGKDYLTELKRFRKPWLAMFGEIDQVVPTAASVKNLLSLMTISGNPNYTVAVIPRIGHSPVDVETHRMVRLDNIVINWMHANGIGH
jgi:pimeloyl-ACP methyl ester carboxylesterase